MTEEIEKRGGDLLRQNRERRERNNPVACSEKQNHESIEKVGVIETTV